MFDAQQHKVLFTRKPIGDKEAFCGVIRRFIAKVGSGRKPGLGHRASFDFLPAAFCLRDLQWRPNSNIQLRGGEAETWQEDGLKPYRHPGSARTLFKGRTPASCPL